MPHSCPICESPLSTADYLRALAVLSRREREARETASALRAEVRLREASARAEGEAGERRRNARLLAGRDRELANLRERLRQVESGSTPQTEGFALERQLMRDLTRAFPQGELTNPGRAGDVVHVVRDKRQVLGRIVYECKRTQRIASAHVRQSELCIAPIS